MNATVELNKEFSLVVDYTKTIGEVIANGQYDWVNRDTYSINSSNLSETVKIIEINTKLFHFDSSIYADKVKCKMHMSGYRPATLIELLILDTSHPELYILFREVNKLDGACLVINALGSELIGSRRTAVPHLLVGSGKRMLGMSQTSDSSYDRDGVVNWEEQLFRADNYFLGVLE